MASQHFSITINASKEKVWNTMLGDATYRQWTAPFNAGGSYFEGDWSEGSKMLFLGPDPETGKLGGMISHVKESKAYDFISVEHDGIMKEGIEDFTSDDVVPWKGALENYKFTDVGGSTKLDVELVGAELPVEFVEFMEDAWPKALNLLKDISEK
jgi:uncharacterized protein YndB with AHSA1/START domain